MKKIKLFPFLLCAPILIGCSETKPKQKIILEYAEAGGNFVTDASQLYDDVINKKKSTIYVLGDRTCGGCSEAKGILQSTGAEKHFVSYYIEVKGMSTDSPDYAKIQQATKGASDSDMFKIGDMMPSIYFYYNGEVAFRISYISELNNALKNYIEVSVPNS